MYGFNTESVIKIRYLYRINAFLFALFCAFVLSFSNKLKKNKFDLHWAAEKSISKSQKSAILRLGTREKKWTPEVNAYTATAQKQKNNNNYYYFGECAINEICYGVFVRESG